MKYYIIALSHYYEYYCDPNFTEKVSDHTYTYEVQNSKGYRYKKSFNTEKDAKSYVKKLKCRQT